MRKRGRRILASVSVLAMTALMAGCSKDTQSDLNPDNPTVVEMETYYNGAAKIAFDKLVEEFNNTQGNEKGIYIKASSSGDMNELFDKLDNELKKDEGKRNLPDIICCYGSSALEFDNKGLLVNLDNYFSKDELSEYVDEYIEEGRIGKDDSLIMFPVAKSTEVLTVNKTDWDKFSEACGVDISQLSTWEGIADVSEKYYEWTDSATETPNDGKAMFGRDAFANYMLTGMHQLDADMFKVKDGKAELSLNKEALKKMWDNYYVPYISGYYTSKGRYRSDDMKTGDLIAAIGSSTAGSYYAQEVTVGDNEPYPIETMVMPAPNFEDTEPVVTQQGAGISVIKSDKVKEEAAVTFLKWFTDADVNSEFSVASAYLPVKKEANEIGYMEELISKNDDMKWNDMIRDTMKVAFEESGTYELYTLEPFEGSNGCREILENSLKGKAEADRQTVKESIDSGQMTLKEAVAELNTQDGFDKWYADLETQLENAL